MRFLNFLRWWWNRNDEFTRTIGCFIVFIVIPFVIASVWVGKFAILCILIGAVVIIGGWCLYGLFYWLRNLWQQFDRDEPTEDIRIINRLKFGHSGFVDKDDNMYP